MSFAYYGILSVFICWKWGNWKAWKDYYPTILFLFSGNLVYMFLTQSNPLWSYDGLIGRYPFLEVTTIALLYPSTVILFFTFYPRPGTWLKQAAYMLLWVAIYSAMEYISHITGEFNYDNGWNFLFSIFFNMIMFPLLRLHYKKPLLAWPIGIVLAYAMMFIFNIPFGE